MYTEVLYFVARVVVNRLFFHNERNHEFDRIVSGPQKYPSIFFPIQHTQNIFKGELSNPGPYWSNLKLMNKTLQMWELPLEVVIGTC